LLRVQRLVGRVNPHPRAMTLALRALSSQAFVDWSFGHYLGIAPPEYAGPGPGAGAPATGLGACSEPAALAGVD
ncbi:MAG TPA: NAD(P)/FAD-dependent oxidoreductase, partial [Solirubrobacteraceae bacterium]|nr:NAD(P)/FAD-dependent oxidoreductase [Solirubrobacteraceae bacterium]